MSETKRNVPKLRFPGFTEDWEQRKFSEITVNIGKRNKENLNLEPYAITKDDGFIPQAEAHDEFGYMKETDRKAYNIVKPNSFGYNPARINVGSIGYYSGSEDIIVSSLYEIFQTSENIYDRFLWHWFKSKQFQNWIERLQEGSVRLYFYYDKLCECEIFIPTVDEQIKIGNSLDRLDNLITLHQRKLENLKLKKKALLQKLFPKNGEQFPELRFPGFTDAWEQRKLSDFTERVVRKNGAESDRPLTISAQDGLVDQREYFNRQVASKDMSNYYLIKNGEFAYNKSYSEGYPFGAVKRLDYYESGALSTLYIVFKLIDTNVLSDFIVAYYMTHLWYGEISKRASEGARNHGLLNISPADFFQSEMLIPTNMNEQYLIGKFFENFDNLITLHQRKLEHLQLQKKALLQQMFV